MTPKEMTRQSQTWTRADFIKELHQHTSLSWLECTNVLEQLLSLIKEGLLEGKQIKLRRFGTFYVATVKARGGRHFTTGEKTFIPARLTVRFRRSALLEQSLNTLTASDDL